MGAVAPLAWPDSEHYGGAPRDGAPGEKGTIMNIITRLRSLVRKGSDSGQDLLEYALLVALIALVCAAVVTLTGTGVSNIFTDINTELTNAAP